MNDSFRVYRRKSFYFFFEHVKSQATRNINIRRVLRVVCTKFTYANEKKNENPGNSNESWAGKMRKYMEKDQFAISNFLIKIWLAKKKEEL